MRSYHIGLLVTSVLMLAGCGSRLTVQKRHHRPGYYVDLGRIKEADTDRQIAEARVSPPVVPEKVTSADEGNAEPTASTGDEVILVPARAVQQLNSEVSRPADLVGPGNEVPASPPTVRSTRKEIRRSKAARADVDGDPWGTLRIVGVVLTLLGLLVLLFLSILIGALLLIVGLIFWIGSSGPRSNERSEKERRPVWQDVVYLKNGSIIRGMIMEQIPDRSLKIQMADGSVLVFEMDQIEKITKEQKP